MSEYWKTCAEYALDEIGLTATAEQVASLADLMERAAEMKSEYTGEYLIPDPVAAENERLSKALAAERSKVGCSTCGGTGRLKYMSGPWACNTECDHCHGEGKVQQ